MTAPTTSTARTLYRSTRDKKVAGVCGGLAEAMGWDPTTVRLIAALSILLPGPQVIAYLVAWIVMPTDEQAFGWAPQPQQQWPQQPAGGVPPMPEPPPAAS